MNAVDKLTKLSSREAVLILSNDSIRFFD